MKTFLFLLLTSLSLFAERAEPARLHEEGMALALSEDRSNKAFSRLIFDEFMNVVAKNTFQQEQNITTFKLKNGMEVVLKYNDFDEEEVLIQLVAKGGYAEVPPEETASARVSADLAWEAGFGPYNGDQFSNKLYNYSLEMTIQIHPYFRKIDGAAETDSLENWLHMAKMIFTEPNLSLIAYQNAVKVLQKPENHFTGELETDEEALKLLNTNNFAPFKPLRKLGLSQIDVQKARDFFLQSFSNPGDFICIIVGNFDKDKTRIQVEETLGSIPEKPSRLSRIQPIFPSFPQNNPSKLLFTKNRGDSVTYLTFPVLVKIGENNIEELELTNNLIQVVLRQFFNEQTSKSQGLDVSYEFPFYPFLDNPWITIKFHSPYEDADTLAKQILDKLMEVKRKGVSSEVIQTALKQIDRSEEYWQRENSYWQAELANLTLWKWNYDLLKPENPLSKTTPDEALKFINLYLNTSSYTKLTTKNI